MSNQYRYLDNRNNGEQIFDIEAKSIVEADAAFEQKHPQIKVVKSPWLAVAIKEGQPS